ncbi:hypothetical protein CHCC14820_1060 [Bacillus paralicheniformis]|nr:hypothetical protein B4123_3730 [Bacillus paralicheniformis]TWJ57678.1 hypothetical protein CHCC5023_2196 [Bacillus paralicheniformis]TWJ69179.1 hypothetical protein CHCC5019_0039 [Bacillus paralicheniformis]TWM33173.1 hypothetical protein CHCC14820_1060 [Bacillus paralicheniformis]TWN99388.1 hypothetical protein CHCC20490_2632 [Bacillus paralicheniformis]
MQALWPFYRFQEKVDTLLYKLMHELSANGIYGPKTKAKIEALLK